MATAKKFQVNTLSGGSLTTGLVSYWNMQGNSNDFYGSNNGTDTSVSYGTSYGKVGEGALFGSSSANIDVGNAITPTTSISIAFWVYFTSNPAANYYGIVGKYRNSGAAFSYLIQTNATGANGSFQGVWTLDGTNDSYFQSTTVVSQNAWHFVVLTMTTGGSAHIYVDNSSDSTTSISSGSFNYSSSYNTKIGNRQDNLAQFPGYLDEVGIWSRALTTNEISDLYNGGAGQTMCWGDTQSDSMMNAASRFTTLAGNLLILVRNVSVTMMNAASRLATLTGTITKYVVALSVSMMNSASRLATLFGQQMQYIANLSVSMMNAVSRFVVLETGNAKILVVNMMNAAGRLTTLFSRQMLFIRNLTVNMMYAVNRLTSFLVTIPGTWAFRAKNLTSWAFRSKNNTSWTFRTKNPLGAENIPSEPN